MFFFSCSAPVSSAAAGAAVAAAALAAAAAASSPAACESMTSSLASIKKDLAEIKSALKVRPWRGRGLVRVFRDKGAWVFCLLMMEDEIVDH